MPIQIAQAYEPVEVDLWGELHKTRPVTRSVEKAIAKATEKLDAAGTTDLQVKCLAEIISLRLERSAAAAAAIDKKWKADELAVPQLVAFAERLAEADRPF